MSLLQINHFIIGRKPIAPYRKKTEPCQNCVNHFEEQFKQINNTIQNLQETIVNQNVIIMKAKRKVLAERILYQEVNLNNLANKFHLNCLNSLNEINYIINETNRKDCTNTMKSILKGHLPKTLTEIISTDFCMDINLDRVHGKNRLKDIKLFYDVLTYSLRSLGSQGVNKGFTESIENN